MIQTKIFHVLLRSFRLSQFFGDIVPPYVILSHTWSDDEVLFQDVQHGEKDSYQKKEGFQKIEGCCRQALANHYEWVWIDTCCIDKSSSAELSEAINSMYRWYRESEVCYAYLADVQSFPIVGAEVLRSHLKESGFTESRWFTRGWTLQELIAPRYLEFYAQDWICLGSKFGLRQFISEITSIHVNLLSTGHLEPYDVAEKMSWASNRNTTRMEDEAYCLLGIFDVNMPLLYGEGKKAFIRLQQEIIRQREDYSIMLWSALTKEKGSDSLESPMGILAKSPKSFRSLDYLEPARNDFNGVQWSEMSKVTLRSNFQVISDHSTVFPQAESHLNPDPLSITSRGILVTLNVFQLIPERIETMGMKREPMDVLLAWTFYMLRGRFVCLKLSPDFIDSDTVYHRTGHVLLLSKSEIMKSELRRLYLGLEKSMPQTNEISTTQHLFEEPSLFLRGILPNPEFFLWWNNISLENRGPKMWRRPYAYSLVSALTMEIAHDRVEKESEALSKISDSGSATVTEIFLIRQNSRYVSAKSTCQEIAVILGLVGNQIWCSLETADKFPKLVKLKQNTERRLATNTELSNHLSDQFTELLSLGKPSMSFIISVQVRPRGGMEISQAGDMIRPHIVRISIRDAQSNDLATHGLEATPGSESQLRQILNWLTAVDYVPQQHDCLSRRQAGTGNWLLDSTEFKSWMEMKRQKLFCQGIPGTGKTILTSIVVDELTNRFRYDGKVAVTYVYFDRERQHEQKAEDVLASLLKQLAQDLPGLPEGVISLYNKHEIKRTRPSLGEISQALASVARLYTRVFIVVDALDECQTTNACRSKFLTEIFALQSKCNASIFATASRFHAGITERFKQSILLEIRATQQDLQTYLDAHMSPGQSFRHLRVQYPHPEKQIKRAILKSVSGVFLFAHLHLQLFTSLRSVEAIQHAISSLPQSEYAYRNACENAMRRMREGQGEIQRLAFEVLWWTALAKRPLTTSELQHALVIGGFIPELDEGNIVLIEIAVSSCFGLVRIDRERDVVCWVHNKMQAYFKQRQDAELPAMELNIASTCFVCLTSDSFESGPCRTDGDFEARLLLNPLYDYAAHNWGHHARMIQTKFSTDIMSFLQNTNKLMASIQMLMVDKLWSAQPEYSQEYPIGMTGLHLASYFGLDEVVQELLINGANVEVKDSSNRTPLSYAAENGHYAIVDMLLARDQVSVDVEDAKYRRTPLSLAAANGHKEVVKRLLYEMADIKSADSYNRTSLSYAIENGHCAVVELLMAKGQPVDDVNDRQTPLGRAAANGHKDIVKLLLNKAADVNFEDTYGRAPLSYAIENGHGNVVELLLATGQIDVNTEYGTPQRTPLSWAASYGDEAIVKQLLNNAAGESKDTNGRTPLSWAAANGHEAVVKLLLEIDHADIDIADTNYGQTPLSWAAANGHYGVVKLLLEKGANAGARDKEAWTPLNWAVVNGHHTVARLLHTDN